MRVSTVALSRDFEACHVNLILAAHRHQPLGSLPAVINDACDRAYLPYLEVLADHPTIRINLHYSGTLLECLDENRPDALEALASRDDQIEWMGGAFYDPILPSIPAQDALAQVSLQSKFLQDRFHRTPRGMWLAERGWDPSLPSLLRKAGMEYTLLDEHAFALAGYSPGDLTDSFITDHLGNTLTIFPIARELRDAFRRTDPEGVMALLRDRHDRDPQSLAVIADDGEKSSLGPHSPEKTDGSAGWLEEFFTLVEEADWVETTTFESYIDDRPAARPVAIPAGSYRLMSEWSPLPETVGVGPGSEDGRNRDWSPGEAFRWEGWWPDFLIRYPEAAALYRKMLRVSDHVAAGKEAPEAHAELLKAQGKDHFQPGGLYSPHVRATAHRHLITAQTMIDANHHRGRAWTYLRHLDWDADGRDEVEVELPDQAWVLDPAEGGCLLYYDDKPTRWSIGDVVARSYEPYHTEAAETPRASRDNPSLVVRPPPPLNHHGRVIRRGHPPGAPSSARIDVRDREDDRRARIGPDRDVGARGEGPEDDRRRRPHIADWLPHQRPPRRPLRTGTSVSRSGKVRARSGPTAANGRWSTNRWPWPDTDSDCATMA